MKRVGVQRTLGEFLLIVVGVLVALALEGYAQDRANHRLATRYEENLARDLRTDTALVRIGAAMIALKISGLAEIEAQLAAPDIDAARLATALEWAGSRWQPAYRDDTYSELVSSGNLALLDFELRNRLAFLHRRYAADDRAAGTQESTIRRLGLGMLDLGDRLWRCWDEGCIEGEPPRTGNFEAMSTEARRQLERAPADTLRLLRIREEPALTAALQVELRNAYEARRRLERLTTTVVGTLEALEARTRQSTR